MKITRLLPALLFSTLGLAGPVTVQVPVVLDVTGVNGAHFTADLTLINLSGISPVELTFVPAGGAPIAPVVTEFDVDGDARFYLDDVIGYLRSRGAAIPAGNAVGSLLVRLPGVANDIPPYVGSRISTPNPSAAVGGSFGTYSVGVPIGTAVAFQASVYGLRESGSQRTNLALVHTGGGSKKPIELRVQLYDGRTGLTAGEPIVRTLQPFEFHQIGSVLNHAQLEQGWAKVTQTLGDDRFLAYAAVNDGGFAERGTSDGSIIEANVPREGVIPVVLTAGAYKTELVLTNDSASESLVTLFYAPSEAFSPPTFPGLAARVTMAPRTQIIEPDALAFIRRQGLGIPEDGPQGGLLRVAGASAVARVYSPNPDTSVGGSFGVAYPAVAADRRAKTEAWLYGVRQDETSRANLAVANAITSGDALATFEAQIFKPGFQRVVKTLGRSIRPGQWFQWNSILADTGLTAATVLVKCTMSTGVPCDFVTYAVVNDGSGPGVGTSDGSYIPMVVK